jgi:hypothetical protein
MGDTEHRFQSLAEQFNVLTHNLSQCKDPNQRRELLNGMMRVIDDIDNVIADEHSLLDSKPESTAPSNPPLIKAAHQ